MWVRNFGTVKGIPGGNFLVMGRDRHSALSGAEAAQNVITGMHGVVAGFPGGIVGSGSKVGCANLRLPESGKHQPSLVSGPEEPRADSLVLEGVAAIYEIVLNGVDETSVKSAMRAGIRAATETGAIMYIGASNFEGKLGRSRFSLPRPVPGNRLTAWGKTVP